MRQLMNHSLITGCVRMQLKQIWKWTSVVVDCARLVAVALAPCFSLELVSQWERIGIVLDGVSKLPMFWYLLEEILWDFNHVKGYQSIASWFDVRYIFLTAFVLVEHRKWNLSILVILRNYRVRITLDRLWWDSVDFTKHCALIQ
jgi:hypothetical protein